MPARFDLEMSAQEATKLNAKLAGYAWGVVAPVICTSIDWPLRHQLGPASILMIYLLGVFLVASRYGRGPSIVASFLSAPAFAFYFASPIFSFAISDLENIIGLAVMIVVANVTGSLLEKSRLQAELAKQRESHTLALYHLSRNLAMAEHKKAVARIASEHIKQALAADSMLLMPNADRVLQVPEARQPPPKLPALDHVLAQRAFETASIQHSSQLIYYPLSGSASVQAVLVMSQQSNLNRPTPELDTVLNLIAQTLERFDLAAQAKEATLQAETESLRNALLSSISHDLRTPLTRIMGAAGTLIENDGTLSSGERDELQHSLLDEAQRMSDLTGKLLDMARLSSGQIALHPDWNAIEEIVGSALNRLDRRLQDRPVRTLLPDSLPLLWIDAVLMEQVFVNLIENAVKYTPPGSPIDIEAASQVNRLRLTVTDYGPGIAQHQRSRIFEKFYRGNPESDESGVGLGLALCKAIVEAHGGNIQAQNPGGKGAEFVIELPLREPPQLATTEPGEALP